jgi:hypothetical protein
VTLSVDAERHFILKTRARQLPILARGQPQRLPCAPALARKLLTLIDG